jgi:hypothetical protein
MTRDDGIRKESFHRIFPVEITAGSLNRRAETRTQPRLIGSSLPARHELRERCRGAVARMRYLRVTFKRKYDKKVDLVYDGTSG